METNQETSEVTNSTPHELNVGEKIMNPRIPVENDVGESSSNNAIVTDVAAVSTHPFAKEVYAIGTSSFSRMRQPPAFLQKVYDIVRNPETDSIISWNSTGTSFIVWDPHKFAAEVLGNYFRHNNFSSFVCQLNTYGFKKINWDRFEFQNEWFQKGKRSWLKKIKRRNQSTQNVQQTRVIETTRELTLPEKQKKLENLIHEHDALKEELMKLKQVQEDLQKEMTTLEQQAHYITSKQQKILNYLIQDNLMRKKGVQITTAELLDEGETSHKNIQSDTKKEKCSIVVGSTFSDFCNADYASLEKQLMDDLNCENVPEEERTKLQQSNAVIALEDLIAGPADWTEFAKELANKARNKS
ncbi:hypothetical protein ACH5RR_015003 [Cinchona calisaya]|uniref:HSF-type DNA-binding domain-containing protein n=1 Tax=Cinchona calisaya TaxID=153742 RepID=A0ABD2ZSQ8_9GENT